MGSDFQVFVGDTAGRTWRFGCRMEVQVSGGRQATPFISLWTGCAPAARTAPRRQACRPAAFHPLLACSAR